MCILIHFVKGGNIFRPYNLLKKRGKKYVAGYLSCGVKA